MKGFAVGDQRADPSTYGTLRAAGLSPHAIARIGIDIQDDTEDTESG